ncbi:hypothetical protein SAMN05444678_111122 [Sphingomonas sp. YR710]|jgi:hypothetical protein|uniref:hypothetical protein n=1 Tax=Sphingomonas sp. YR710 TaxID=1882773 RepID=UPI00088EB6D2|nr:hypothetical protein [Sphingomonas sp. YR710]SDD29882.1 hypothetical protein SAMN05444678_111122 [Sphingomonas sp. YR710]
MKKLMAAALLVVMPAGVFAQILPALTRDAGNAQSYTVDHPMARPHMIGNIQARSVRVGGHTLMLVDGIAPKPNNVVAATEFVASGS